MPCESEEAAAVHRSETHGPYSRLTSLSLTPRVRLSRSTGVACWGCCVSPHIPAWSGCVVMIA